MEKLTEGISTLAAAFWPRPVIVRLSDFKSNEYRKLLGGELYEPLEENPMLGFRGAGRYVAKSFRDCFELECRAMKKVRDGMGYTNVEIMVPFVRTVQEAREVVELLAQNGLKRGEKGLRLIMMCEIPSNALLAEEFLQYFDGFSIGSNDLTQLTLGWIAIPAWWRTASTNAMPRSRNCWRWPSAPATGWANMWVSADRDRPIISTLHCG